MQSKFTKWLRVNRQPGGYELKLCKKKSMPFNAVQEHQVNALIQTETVGLAYKISDFSPEMKPYDCIYIKGPAYVVIGFWEPRSLRVYVIRIYDFITMRDEAGRKSMTEEMAIEYGNKITL